ncbi:PDZ domain-containing protein [Nitriliruptor alkaliphilus]|uniref:PDZ domain-containing protein n=1 Tax=Nitriliruptor alkaliphilus TaxID=427918 RepID=UPI000696C22B|nr:PDZ domain-containing protein [Nitriliruptor alkaliphilus]
MSDLDLARHGDGPEDGDRAGGHPRGGRPHRPGRAPRPSLARTITYALSLAAIVWAVLVVPLPYVVYVPGTPTEIPPLIEVTGTETTPIEGRTALLTVFLRDATPYTAAQVLLDPARDLAPAATVAPDGLTPEFFEAQQATFAEAFQIASALGAQAAGVEVGFSTEVRVVDVLPGSPAAGVLAPGDQLLAVDGQTLTDAAELQARTRAADDGDRITLTVDHAGAERDVTVTLRPLGGTDQVGLGVLAETTTVGLELPFDVSLKSTRIGGPSAGMMTAVTVYDLLSEEDLIAGRTVLGTGSMSASGQVGPVGGVPEKVRSAAAFGADLVLVPSTQLEAALLAAPDDLEVIGVATLDEAIEALRSG